MFLFARGWAILFDAGCVLWATVRRRSFLVCAVGLGGLGGLVEGARLRGKYRLGGFFLLDAWAGSFVYYA